MGEVVFAVQIGQDLGISDGAAGGLPVPQPRSTSPRTSSTRPVSNIRSVRRAIRSSSSAVSRSTPMMTVPQRGRPITGADAANGRPVSSTTSSARTIRLPSVGRMVAAAAGSAARKASCTAATPRSASSVSQRARTSGSVAGKSHWSSSACTYIIEPPTMTGVRSRAMIASTSADAAA